MSDDEDGPSESGDNATGFGNEKALRNYIDQYIADFRYRFDYSQRFHGHSELRAVVHDSYGRIRQRIAAEEGHHPDTMADAAGADGTGDTASEKRDPLLDEAEHRQYLSAMLSILKGVNPGYAHTDESLELTKSEYIAMSPPESEYFTVLDEMAYLHQLFKKLRFSYREQLTKETVVRRILELELPLLTPIEIEALLEATEHERHKLASVKSQGAEVEAYIEREIRALTEEKRRLVQRAFQTDSLPARAALLRQRQNRVKVALVGELVAMDSETHIDTVCGDTNSKPALDPAPLACSQCSRRFFSKVFYDLHCDMHGDGSATLAFPPLFLEQHRATISYEQDLLSLLECEACPGVELPLVAPPRRLSGPEAATHTELHARIEKGMERVDRKLAHELVTVLSGGSTIARSNAIHREAARLERHVCALHKREATALANEEGTEEHMKASLEKLSEIARAAVDDMTQVVKEGLQITNYTVPLLTDVCLVTEQANLLNLLVKTTGEAENDEMDWEDYARRDAEEDAAFAAEAARAQMAAALPTMWRAGYHPQLPPPPPPPRDDIDIFYT